MTLFDHPWSGVRAALLASALACAGLAQAQEQSMEARLRAQLRTVTGQLQQAQNELAQFKAGAPAARPAQTADAEALRAELAQSQAQLARERDARSRRDAQFSTAQQQAQEAVAKASAQVAQFRGAYDELLKMARAAESERHKLAQQAGLQQTAIAQCEAKNQQLYAVGMEVVQAYEQLDMGALMSVRQPFAAQSRVKFEQIAQEYGDRLYQGKFDARAAHAPQVAESGEAAAAAARTTP